MNVANCYLTIFLILSSWIQLNRADNMLSMKLFSLVDKWEMTSSKFSSNLHIMSIKTPLDLKVTRKGSDAVHATRSHLPANLRNQNNSSSYVVDESAQDAKEEMQPENESKTFETPLLSSLTTIVLWIITFLSLKVISKFHLKKIEPMIFALTLFCLVNPVYLVGPLFETSSMSYGNFNETDDPLPWKQSRLTNKSIMANRKISANLKINDLKLSFDISQAKFTPYLNILSSQRLLFNLKDSNYTLCDVNK